MDPAPAPPSTAVIPPAAPPRVIAGLGDLPAPSRFLGPWPRSALFAAVALLGAGLALLGVHAASYLGGRPADLQTPGLDRIDLNGATVAELQHLPGIGPKLAERIDEYRRAKGKFRTVDDLRNVPGIGPTVLERLRPYVTIADAADAPKLVTPKGGKGADPPPATKKAAAAPKGMSKKELALQGVVIDVNRAPLSELQRLPGIGAKLSQRIVEEREKRPFQTVDDLRRVYGIWAKTLETLRPYVTVGDGRSGD